MGGAPIHPVSDIDRTRSAQSALGPCRCIGKLDHGGGGSVATVPDAWHDLPNQNPFALITAIRSFLYDDRSEGGNIINTSEGGFVGELGENTKVQSRSYREPADLERIVTFLMACRAANPGGDDVHVGDFLWGLRDLAQLDRNIRLWETSTGDLVGFAKADSATGDLLYQAAPTPDEDSLSAQLLDWGLSRLEDATDFEGRTTRVTVHAREDNKEKIALLESRGFTRETNVFIELLRPLKREIPPPELPAGFSLRHLAGPDEVPTYVALHRDDWSTWGPSRYSVGSHLRLASNPGYAWNLTPVVVAPNGALAASCICWLDPLNKVGTIEPLGTRPAYRGRGLARAVVLQALHLMKTCGIETARVLGASVNVPALRLYEMLGFRPGPRNLIFSRAR